jgi:hypothetical protein
MGRFDPLAGLFAASSVSSSPEKRSASAAVGGVMAIDGGD